MKGSLWPGSSGPGILTKLTERTIRGTVAAADDCAAERPVTPLSSFLEVVAAAH